MRPGYPSPAPQDIWIIGIRTGAHYHSDIYESKYRVFVRDGSVYGTEISKQGWTQYGFKQVCDVYAAL